VQVFPAAGDSDAISPLGKWSLAATFLVWYPGYARHRQPLQQRTIGRYSTARALTAGGRYLHRSLWAVGVPEPLLDLGGDAATGGELVALLDRPRSDLLRFAR